MTVSEYKDAIGTTVSAAVEQTLRVTCTVIDVRQTFGRIDYLVSPVNGTGSQWISASRITPFVEFR